MLKRLSAALLLGGLFLGLSPTAAFAYYDRNRDDHYRCMYHCAERGYGSGSDPYRSDPYRSDRYRDDRYGRYGYDRYRRDRVYHNGECFEHDDSGWHRCGYRRYRYYDRSYYYDRGYYDRGYYYGDSDSAHASGGYDSHRHHPR